jgi:hypothetical protein
MSEHDNNLAPDGPDRRQFLQTTGLTGVALALSENRLGAQAPFQLKLTNTGPDQIPRKPFGRTTETVSVIGLGGYSLGDAPSLREAIAIVHEAVDAGVNFFDNAWEYPTARARNGWGRPSRVGATRSS